MKNIAILVFILLLCFALVLFIFNPALLDQIWLWLIGFAGSIIGLFRNLWEQLTHKDEKSLQLQTVGSASAPTQENSINLNTPTPPVQVTVEQPTPKNTPVKDTFDGTTLTVLRYINDGSTTLGLFYFRNTFFSYTLEDTYRKEKIMHETRISAGTYLIDFIKQETGLTTKYRNRFPWFTYHIEIKNVPNYTGVYIHIGNTKKDTSGCLLLADGVTNASVEKSLISSTSAYQRFYTRISDLLNSGEKVRLVIRDEDWFQKNNIE